MTLVAGTVTLIKPVPTRWRENERPADRRSDGPLTVLAFLSNRKPNTDVMQRELAERIRAARPGLRIEMYEKPNAAAGADQAMLDKIARDCHAAINATGD